MTEVELLFSNTALLQSHTIIIELLTSNQHWHVIRYHGTDTDL